MWPIRDSTVAWRASRIQDPISRLRYLRRQANRLHRKAGVRHFCILLSIAISSVVLAPGGLPHLPQQAARPQPTVSQASMLDKSRLWLVERTLDHETFSNGLRIDTRYAISHHRRSYLLFTGDRQQRFDTPAGIVYHSTESHMAPFGPEYNDILRETAEQLTSYIQRHRSYNYVIDRFGRVFRVVEEADAADHAGNSAWAWNGSLCLNLNHAFLGVAFEARTSESLSSAQLHAGRILTDVLRSRYSIPVENCVTHAQVSVNPGNMKIGWHTDWARKFPFREMGLPNNYERTLPSVTEFGFSSDSAYLEDAGEGLWIGVYRSEESLRLAAAARGLPPALWRRKLRERYQELAGRG